MPTIFTAVGERFKTGILRALGSLHRLAIGPYGTAILSRTEHGLLLTPAGDFMVGRRLCFNGRYDPELLSLITETCGPTSQILFVGAHIGALAIPAASKVKNVIAIEPNPSTFELLRMNVALNGLGNLEIHNFAAGDGNGEVAFLASTLNSGGSGIAIGDWNRWAYGYDKPEKINVRMRRLDDVFPGAHFDLIVMDIEGAETLALKGMTTVLGGCRALIIEVFESHLKQVAKVSSEEFLSLVAPYFDEATILPEKPRQGHAAAIGPFPKRDFSQMMRRCTQLGMANVMFCKRPGQQCGEVSRDDASGDATARPIARTGPLVVASPRTSPDQMGYPKDESVRSPDLVTGNGRRIRIGLNISAAYGNFGGIGNYAFQLARHLPLVAQEVEWVFFGPDPSLVPELLRENVTVVAAGKTGPARILWEQTALPLAAHAHRIDLLHGADFSRPVFYGKPAVNTIHDLSPYANPRFFPAGKRAYKEALIPMAARRSSAIITVSEFSRRTLLERFPFLEDRLFAIHHGVDLDPANGVERSGATPPFILFVGGLESRKNLVPLIEAFRVLRERRRIPHRLVLAGNRGYGTEQILSVIQASGISDAIELRGYVSRGALLDLYRSASLLVFPSVYEGFGFPVLEAMALGVPVVSSRATALPEVGGDAAVYFDPYSMEDMAAAIERVLDSPTLQVELREKGIKRAAKFTWEECARKHLDVYRRVLDL